MPCRSFRNVGRVQIVSVYNVGDLIRVAFAFNKFSFYICFLVNCKL